MADVTPTRLRCEYLTNPLAVDSNKPRLSWVLVSEARNVRQSAYQILVSENEADLIEDRGSLWDSGRVTSDQTTHVLYAGQALRSGQQVFWKVRVWTNGDEPSVWSTPANWRMGLLDQSDWHAAWIGAPGPVDDSHTSAALPSPMLRKEFKLTRSVNRATVTTSSLGLYELSINGKRVGDHLLAPEWTDFNKRVQYQAYDVTSLLKKGKNAVGAMLGDGWYAGRLGISHIVKREWLRAHYGKRLRLTMQLEVEYTDGSTETIVTDDTWKSTTEGPIRKACILDGEIYDARREMPGWNMPEFDDANWQPVDVLEKIDARLVAQPNEPIRVTEERRPVNITEPSPGIYVVDFGQNMAGWCRISIQAKPGQTIRLRHAEVLQPDGNIYRDNLRMVSLGGDLGARQEDQYTCRSDGVETYEPRFTYHGFRYLEIAGLTDKPSPESITARVFHSAPPMTGSFECSSDLLNQLIRNIVWTHRDNMHSVPTDCPQRDERMGWMGDMLVFAQPACFNMDMGAFFTKWVQDIRDAQAKDGRFPDIAPHPFGPEERFSGAPAWGDAGVIVPWAVYLNYGDKRMIEKQFDPARRWVDWIHRNNSDLLWKNNRNNDYGDWLNGDTFQIKGYPRGQAEVNKELFSTAFFFRSAELVSKMARVLGKEADAEQYGTLAENIRKAFNKAYVRDDGTMLSHTQSTYAIALHFGLLPEDKREAAIRNMVQCIRDYKNHISTGFHTTIMLMRELSANGNNAEAYRLINNRTMPSWGYTIDHGGTTIWERWDGYVEGHGYQTPEMNSFNHYAIGSVGEWMYRTILGINPDESSPGYRHVVLQAQPGGGLSWAKGKYESIQGTIASDWKMDKAGLTWTVTVPANSTATVHVPATRADAVSENGQPVSSSSDIEFVGMEKGTAVVRIGSGTYTFISNGYQSNGD